MARRRKKGDPVHGWLNFNKPEEMTSTQAVRILKRLFNAQKVGHGGTLDPLAFGVLPIAFGEATKTVSWAMDAPKEYLFTILWGASTDTQDREGQIIARSDKRPSPAEIVQALQGFVGQIEQIPPQFSAIKVDGVRAYDIAREGESVELAARQVVLHSAELIECPDPDRAVIRVRTGKGFYVRALARDLAIKLDTEGHIERLQRTQVGSFSAECAISLANLEKADKREALKAYLLPIHAMLDDIPALEIGSQDVFSLRQGRQIVMPPYLMERWKADQKQCSSQDKDDRLAVAIHKDMAVALGQVRAGRFTPNRVFQYKMEMI